MALNPIPLTTDGSGPEGAIPVTISGVEPDLQSFSDFAGSVTGASGSDLQAILEDIVNRLEAAEAS